MSSSEYSLSQSPLCGEASASPRLPRYAGETKNRKNPQYPRCGDRHAGETKNRKSPQCPLCGEASASPRKNRKEAA